MLKQIFDIIRHPIQWISSKQNRLRLLGSRIEVIILVMCRNNGGQILLGKSVYHDIWMPVQEGVKIDESIEDAMYRCLNAECGIEISASEREEEKLLYLHSTKYAGILKLPEERIGERLVADDAIGTFMEEIRLVQKAYWVATLVVDFKTSITPKPDGREIIELQWFGFSDAEDIIKKSNRPDKSQLLLSILAQAKLDIIPEKNF